MINHDVRYGDRTRRICEGCQQRKPKEYGQYWKYNNGMNQKWFCATCYEKRNKR